KDSEVEEEVAPFMRREGYLTKPLFLKLARWKSMRPLPHYNANVEEDVEAVTRLALSTRDERLRIGLLTTLRGVQWPLASTILHLGHAEPYPILDVRALWSLS